MSEIELVIARHEEDLAWTRNAAPGIRITVYNKGHSGSSFPHSISLPNQGREAHTYLHHIVNRYRDLSPATVFCQGHPFDHCSDFHAILRELRSSEFNLLPAFRWLGFIIDWDDVGGQRLFRNWSKNEKGETLDMDSFCRKLWGQETPAPFVFYPGAQFIVTRELLLSKPRGFYEHALETSLTFPNAPHCFERTWDRVFGVDGIPEEYRGKTLPLYLKPIKRLNSL